MTKKEHTVTPKPSDKKKTKEMQNTLQKGKN